MELLMRVWDWQTLLSAGDLLGPERRHSRTEPPRFLDSESGAAFLCCVPSWWQDSFQGKAMQSIAQS
jgi:hypothetical protein